MKDASDTIIQLSNLKKTMTPIKLFFIPNECFGPKKAKFTKPQGRNHSTGLLQGTPATATIHVFQDVDINVFDKCKV